MSYRNSSKPIFLDKVKKEAVIDWVLRRSLSLVAVQATAQEYYSEPQVLVVLKSRKELDWMPPMTKATVPWSDFTRS